ncbi:MAG: T9SS-dependent M36 family metallopeptidase [Bacteroidetes bacterium]|nr:T9SS-dependent M36 family metallopeptidase [Bacteroidota bacterium]
MTKRLTTVFAVMFFCITQIFAQSTAGSLANDSYRTTIQNYLSKNQEALKLSADDIKDWTISDAYTSNRTQTSYIYVQQQVNGISIFNGVSSASVKGGEVKSFAKRLITNAATNVNATTPSLSPSVAIRTAAAHLNLSVTETPKLLSHDKAKNFYTYSKAGISLNNITAELVYLPVKGKLKLAWNVVIRMTTESHWWNIRIDALTGEFMEKNDWTVHCDFGPGVPTPASALASAPVAQQSAPSVSTSNSVVPQYRVYPFPLEAPSFGASSLRNDPSDATASPFGWHDTDGIIGAEYTITRGNNVHAYDDIANQDQPGTSPDGTSNLIFDYPINFNTQPVNYLDASNTNLFYVNNMMHDIMYHYGFDEAGGNYQENNYGNGGLGADYVHAECQDGGGTNNANFSSPPDGQNGWMQMYLWSASASSTFTVNSPGSIAGSYAVVGAAFGPGVTSTITADLALVDDGAAPTSDGCSALVNGAAVSGKIAVIDRGTCNFVDKVLSAQNANAVAAIVINNVAGAPFAMSDNGSGGSVTIPAVMISQADGTLLKATMASQTVNGTLAPPATGGFDIDGSLDNGVVTHEYGHGISVRLTGGPSNANCLDNGEQAGEGWSDYFALLMTLEPSDLGTNSRGIGTYALGESTSGAGIRRYPYSTNMAINPQTYGDLATSPEVHDIGEIWCQVLWDMTWNLIDQAGLDTNWISGTGGNNIALNLVMEGMKLQPCSPGFLDGRDAILQADDNLYGGIHKCLIWESFARRGMGYGADQGSSQTAGDETEDFSIPPFCQNPTSAPTADFIADVTSTCYGVVHFTDMSTDIPQSWAWDFGDGGSSTLQNPTHTYTTAGTFTVTLTVTNTIGNDVMVKSSYISIIIDAAPTVSGDTLICSGDATLLTANVSIGNDAEWYDVTNTLLATGTTYTTPNIFANTTYNVRQITPTTLQNVGPVNATFGAGGYHNTSFEGRELFTTLAPLRLKSVWVDASGTADRTFNLYNGNGSLITSKTVNVVNGQGRVDLNFDIPSIGDYQLGVTAGSNLYRNNAGANYPYTLAGLVTITSSNSTTNQLTYYYYCYDWQVQELPCTSAPAVVNVTVSSAAASQFTYSATGLDVQFTDASTGSITGYLWDFGDGGTSTSQSPQHTFAANGTYTVSLLITTADGCQISSTQFLTVTDVGVSELMASGIEITGKGNDISIHFETAPSDAHIRITDALGQIVVNEVFSKGTLFTTSLDKIASSYVMITVQMDDKSISKKYFIRH